MRKAIGGSRLVVITGVAVLVSCGLWVPLLRSQSKGPDPAKPDPTKMDLIESISGPALYKAYCAVCHGSDGKGGGPMANSLKIKAPDLTRISIRNGGKFPAKRVQHIILSDQALAESHGPREMPVWGPLFSQIGWDQDLGRVRADNLAKTLEDMQAK